MEPLDSHEIITPEQTERDNEALRLYHRLNCDANGNTHLALAGIAVPNVIMSGSGDEGDPFEVLTDTPEPLPLDALDVRRIRVFLLSEYFPGLAKRYLHPGD